MSKTENRESRTAPKRPADAAVKTPAAGPEPSTLSQLGQWLTSSTVRHATAMRKHVQKLVNHQRDILSSQAVGAIEASVAELKAAVWATANKETLEKQMSKLEEVA